MLETSGLYYPNRLARAFFLAMDDVMGRHGLSTLLGMAGLEQFVEAMPPDNLNREFDFAWMSAMNIALEEMYGSRGGRGMALRVGRAAFAMGFKSFGIMRGMNDPAFRALLLTKRVEYGLAALASLYGNFTDQVATVEQSSEYLILNVENSPMAYGRMTDKPVCHAQVGIIQECLRWASNGYEFYVRETACVASGADRCVFRVNKVAIGELNSV